MREIDDADRRALFPGDSRMAARMRELDWSATPLGDARTWPAVLATSCRICLTSRFPMIVWWGPDLRFFYNDAYLPLLGAKHPALGKPGREVWPEIWHIIGPMLDGVLASGEATWSEDLMLPVQRHGYDEESYWTYSYSPLYDAGQVAGVFTAVSDTTERVVGERRLAVLRDLGSRTGAARSVTEASRLVTTSLRGAGAEVPYAAVYLRAPGADDFTLTSSTLPGDRSAPQAWPLAEAVHTGKPVVVRDVRSRLDDLPAAGWRHSPAEALVLPLGTDPAADALGAIVLAAGAGHRLDEAYQDFLRLVAHQTDAIIAGAQAYAGQQRRAENLAELDLAKTAFFANVSHELRTPLTLITGPVAELLAADTVDEPRLRTELEMIQRNALRLVKLVNTLLDFSRIEAGRQQARYERVELDTYTAELAGVFRAAIEAAGLTFTVDSGPLRGPVHVDRSMWEKIVLNLLSNALKFTFDGSITLRLRDEGEHAVLTVTDTGTGIAAAELPRLFERFHRIPNARARSNEGSGIGLALVRELVGLHGGTIVATSTEDAGTTFTVRIPLGTRHLPDEVGAPVDDSDRIAEPFVQEATHWLAPRPGEATPVDAGPATVLIADDNADMREYLGRLLRPLYRVVAVADGDAALAAIRADPPDLVISDVMMPHLDGLALVAGLRADYRTARVPVVLLSARAGQESAIDGLAAGADDYLVKPFEGRELLARVQANLRLARLRNHHADWRAALVNSLQEGFFLTDDQGMVVEVNEAFGELLGYGSGDLPYPLPHPWWPDAVAEAADHALVADAFEHVRHERGGVVVLPFRHRDGRRVWAALTYNEVHEYAGSARMVVGTLRDVTAERRENHRETAQARLSTRLAEAAGVGEVIAAGLRELAEQWQARRGLAVVWGRSGPPAVVSTNGNPAWADLSEQLRERLTALRSAAPLRIETATDAARPTLVRGAGTSVGYPDGDLVMWLEWAPAYRFDPGDKALLALLHAHIGQAAHRAHLFEQQREVALALQRSILGPSALPDGFAVRYEPAGQPLEVGGDWYDVVDLSGGRIGVVVGDCVGRGITAAAVMGQLRSACRALLLHAGTPGQVLDALDDFAGRVPGASCTTVFCGILDPATGVLAYSSAGHPPPILVHAGGETELLEGGRFVPLTVLPGVRQDAAAVVPLGATLLLYTDGLVERRWQSIDDGIDGAAAILRDGSRADVQTLADRVMSGLAPESGYDDDVAVLLYQRPAPLDVEFPAAAERLAPVRHELREWLDRLGMQQELAEDIVMAVGEACANSVEHGCRFDESLLVRLHGTVVDGQLCIAVSDPGAWRPARSDTPIDRGRGLALMRAVMRVELLVDGPGTTVEMRTAVRPSP
jgi:PAS domain S-box-containing protein